MANNVNCLLVVSGVSRELHRFAADAAGADTPLSFHAQVAISDQRLCRGSWGTSSNAMACVLTVLPGRLEYSFYTQWTPPSLWLESVAGRYPQLHFELFCSSMESGYGGYTVADSGRVVESIRAVRRFGPFFAERGRPGFFTPYWETRGGDRIVFEDGMPAGVRSQDGLPYGELPGSQVRREPRS